MRIRVFLATASLCVFAGCDSKSAPDVLDTNPDPMARQLANAAPIELPAAITAEKSFRCRDRSLVKVTFFSGDMKVAVRPGLTGPRIELRAASAGEDFVTEDGWRLTGDTTSIILKRPDKAAMTCLS